MTASAWAVRECIVERRRSREERGGWSPKEVARWAGLGRRAGQAGWGEGRGGALLRRASFSRGPGGETQKLQALFGGALARGLPRRSEPAFYTGQQRRRVLQ